MSQSLKFLSNTYVKICLFVLFLVAHFAVIYWVQPHWVGQGNTPDLFGPTFMVVYKSVVGVCADELYDIPFALREILSDAMVCAHVCVLGAIDLRGPRLVVGQG